MVFLAGSKLLSPGPAIIPIMAVNRLKSLIGSSSRFGLGGEGVLRTTGRMPEALAMLRAAYDAGIRYFDAAPAYAESERYQGRFWAQNPGAAAETFQAGKSAQRSAAGAAGELKRTLGRLQRDHLGLWQIHDVRTMEDIRMIGKPGGALEAFYAAREDGSTRGIGVTGHHDPAVLLHAVSTWDVDAVLLPVNPVEAALGGFTATVIPAARERGIGVIGMKVLGAGTFLFPESGLLPETLIRFALAQDVDLVIVGCSTPEEARALVHAGSLPGTMGQEEQDRIIGTVRPYAERLAFYRGVL